MTCGVPPGPPTGPARPRPSCITATTRAGGCITAPTTRTCICACLGTAEQTETPAPGDPLTAAFEALPTHHDGASAFTFRIAFSERWRHHPAGHEGPRADGD